LSPKTDHTSAGFTVPVEKSTIALLEVGSDLSFYSAQDRPSSTQNGWPANFFFKCHPSLDGRRLGDPKGSAVRLTLYSSAHALVALLISH